MPKHEHYIKYQLGDPAEPQTVTEEWHGPLNALAFHEMVIAFGGVLSIETARRQVMRDESCQDAFAAEGSPITLLGLSEFSR